MSGAVPAVDVAMVTWNTRDVTLEALATLIDLAPEGTKVFVRDNGSTDGTAEAIAEKLPTVNLDAGTSNLGFAAGVNTILRRSTAPWVLLLNSDAWPEAGAIERLVEFATQHPLAAAVAPRLLRPDGQLERSAWVFPSTRVSIGAALRPARYDWPHAEARAVDWAVGAALLIRRSALDQIGELDESLFMYAEDLEWCWRARDAHWQIWFCPDAVVRHVGNASGAQRYGAGQPAAWIASAVQVYRRRHGRMRTVAWRLASAAMAALVRRRAQRAGDPDRANYWAVQLRAWLRPDPAASRGE
jgi:GT2 family glycosyltransferase